MPGRRPRVEGIGLETVGITPDPKGVPVDAHLRVADGLWAIGDVTGIWPLTTTGKYQGDIAAGQALYQRYSCINCHGPNGLGGVPNPQSPDTVIPPLVGKAFPQPRVLTTAGSSQLLDDVIVGNPSGGCER